MELLNFSSNFADGMIGSFVLLLPMLIPPIKVAFPIRIVMTMIYTFTLTWELLLSNPWALFGAELAANPPVNTASDPASFSLHLGAYLGLGILSMWSAESLSKRKCFLVMGLVVVHAFGCELLQTFVPNRWPSVSDITANLIGLTLGALFVTYYLGRFSFVSQRFDFAKTR